MKVRFVPIVTLVCLLGAAGHAHAQCSSWERGPLDDGLAPNGANGTIRAAVVWDPDGAGPLASRLVVGGEFTSIGGVAVTNVAQRDPATGQWAPLGSGINLAVNSLTLFNGQIVAGCSGDNNVGTFDLTVRRWDGSAWQFLPATNTGSIAVMEVYNGALYIGGTFMTHFVPPGSDDAFYIARYNPGANAWDPINVGFGTQTNTAVSALAVYNGSLYVGGWVKNSSSPTGSVLDLARWNSSSGYAQITNGTDLGGGGILDLAVYGGELIVAGAFSTINGAAINCIAGWNGTSFHGFHSGTGGPTFGGGIYSVVVHNGLCIGGVFTTASGQLANHVAFWPPGATSWQPLGGGTDNTVYELVSYGGELVAVGAFTMAERPANHIAHWDGYQWGSFGGGEGSYLLAMTNFNGRIVGGGDFHQTTGALATAHNIASWSGSTAQAIGVGTNGTVWALKGFKYPGFGPHELIAGGLFTTAGGVAANRIARWTESGIPIPPPAWEAMGAGFNTAVYAIERFNGATYAGGAFTASGATGLNRIARWNESTNVWEPMGSGVNGFVYAMKEYNGALYAGGNFSTAGGITTGGLARWDGSSWSAVGGSAFSGVLSLEVHNGRLVIGGQFSGLPGSPNLIQWDGAAFSALGTGGANNNVRALRSNGGRLYAGGDFTSIGGVAVNRIGYWDGTWHDTHYGTDDIVYALGLYNGEIHTGGSFHNVDFGGGFRPLYSPFWGRYAETGLPWFSQQPSPVTAHLGDDVSFTAQVAAGYGGLTYRWYHDDVPLSDGPTGNGSTIGGATTTMLAISDAVWTDRGGYRLVATNGCGQVSSATAAFEFSGVAAVPTPSSGVTAFEALEPNPAVGGSRLSFSLAHDAAVVVRIFDVAGRLVRHIDLGRLPPGRHTARWDARDNEGRLLAAALYLVELDGDGRRIGSKRLTMLH